MPGADVGGLLRSGVASLCLAAGILHVSAAADHRGMAGHVAFFMAVAAAQSALAAAVLLARPARWLAVSAVVNLAVAVVWALSRTTGLPVDGSSAAEAIGFKDGISTMIEIAAAAGAGLWWLLPDGARRVALPSGYRAATLLGTVVWAIGAAGLFAGHTHSPGHTHAAQDAHATAAAGGAGQPHSGDPNHHDERAGLAAPVSHTTTHDPADHLHEPAARPAAIETSASGAHDHGRDHHANHLQPADASKVGSRAAGHPHDHVAADAPQGESGRVGRDDGHQHEPGASGDQSHSGSGHDHNNHDDEGGARNDKGDEDGGASPLEDVLKLIQPR